MATSITGTLDSGRGKQRVPSLECPWCWWKVAAIHCNQVNTLDLTWS